MLRGHCRAAVDAHVRAAHLFADAGRALLRMQYAAVRCNLLKFVPKWSHVMRQDEEESNAVMVLAGCEEFVLLSRCTTDACLTSRRNRGAGHGESANSRSLCCFLHAEVLY